MALTFRHIIILLVWGKEPRHVEHFCGELKLKLSLYKRRGPFVSELICSSMSLSLSELVAYSAPSVNSECPASACTRTLLLIMCVYIQLNRFCDYVHCVTNKGINIRLTWLRSVQQVRVVFDCRPLRPAGQSSRRVDVRSDRSDVGDGGHGRSIASVGRTRQGR